MDNLLERGDANAFFHGAVTARFRDGAMELCRMTDTQLAHLNERSGWPIRARCLAGMTVELCTDSPEIVLRGQVRAAARSYGGFDVEVDGTVHKSIRLDAVATPLELRIETGRDPSGTKKIRIHLPNVTAIVFTDLLVTAGTAAIPVPPHSRMLLTLGDSITQGMCAASPISTYAVQLARFFDMELINQGIGGHVFDASSLPEKGAIQPALITVAYGANDWFQNTPTAEIRDRVDDYLSGIRKRFGETVPIVLISPIWGLPAEETRIGGTLAQFAAEIRNTALHHANVTIVDGFRLVPHDEHYYADGLHPTDEGFMHYTLGLIREAELWKYSERKEKNELD